MEKTSIKSLKGTQTEKNLIASFAGESQARNRYTYAASVAKKAGYEQIAAIFLETAENEKQHAKRFFQLLEGGMVEVNASFPAGVIGDTAANLEAAAEGEHAEWTKIYKDASETAQQEGFDQVSKQFRHVSGVEEQHEKRYRKLIENLKDSAVFKKNTQVQWVCRKCGHVHTGTEAPKICPTCTHPQAYFEIRSENY